MPDIEGYKVTPLRLTADRPLELCPQIFMREHFIRLEDASKPKGRTLFLLNVPPYVSEQSLGRFFRKSVDVLNKVSFAERPGRNESEKWQKYIIPFSSSAVPFKFKVAYVVFQKSTGVQRSLQLSSIDLFNSDGDCVLESGMQLWHSQYEERILDETEAQARIDKYMEAYDKREKKALEAAKNSEADADGWVTVGKQGRNAGFEQKESVVGRLEEKIVRGKKKKELDNFYTFQIRESKMKNIVELRKKFEEDKQKIEALKKTRRFRPF
ncbi:PREDICTED: ribosomal RNA-processing protein 7 homolog A [Rhagoletis zephyria]|uniref:ribosomal RNA-processing protein 7 homolog A n=1 Tax=Rhagoletis zephyria TaxID=28612 RepID=UPI000811551A|nr:PREDICTED: ribosomal RNA-processing protein 7 homolog A [Rhagoletis zephyria]